MNKKISVSVALAITLIAMTVTFSISYLVAMERFNTSVSVQTDRQNQTQYDKIAELDTFARGNYYGDIDDDLLNDRIAQGYLNGLGDKYATYYTAEEYTELLDIESGKLVGIGLEVVRDANNYYRIVKVYEDSPAAIAGVQTGGRITHIGGEELRATTTLPAVLSMLRGEQGTTVELTCLYNNTEEMGFSIQRVNYAAPTIESTILDDYCYIRIFSFGNDTAADFESAVSQALSEGVYGFIFDLRGNTGGSFDAAYKMIDLLCPLGTIAKSENKAGVTRVLATSDESEVELPMVALVDSSTAAAAELFAVSIRDMSSGKIVGTTTAGVGMLQTSPYMLSDGSAVTVSTALLLTGNDETFEGTGLEPEIVVEPNFEDESLLYNPDFLTDNQILRAVEVVRGMARTGGTETGSGGTEAESQTPNSEDALSEDPALTGDEENEGTDEGGEEENTDGGESVPESTPEDGQADAG